MSGINSADLLNAWEQGLNQSPLQRALILLTVGHPEQSLDALMQLSIGQRDSLLLRLRERLFGPQLLNTARCPHCDERIEWENHTGDFIVPASDNEAPGQFQLDTDEGALQFRLPNSLDLAALAHLTEADEFQQQLVSRCLLQVDPTAPGYDGTRFSDAVIRSFSERIEQLDPQADIRIQLACPECEQRWEVLFDIARFLWAEIHDWAQQMLQTVARMAAAYGWSERDILALSPVRRQLYLGMLNQ